MNPHPDVLFDLYKARRREFYQEAERMRLISEARKAQSRLIRTTLTQCGGFFRRFGRKLRIRVQLERAPQKKHSEVHDPTVLRSSHSGR